MRNTKEVVCIEYRKTYEAISLASIITRTDKTNITKACTGELPCTINSEGTILTWMFSDEFILMFGEDMYWQLHRTTQDFYNYQREDLYL